MSDVPQVPGMPAEPFDIDPYVPLPDMLAAAERHEWAVVAASCGVERLPAREVADHALAALALGQAVTIRLEVTRGATIRDALAHGATLDQVAAALDTVPSEVVDDLDGWADAMVLEGAMGADERARVWALVARKPGVR